MYCEIYLTVTKALTWNFVKRALEPKSPESLFVKVVSFFVIDNSPYSLFYITLNHLKNQ